jgi:hypothetical protein
MQVCRNGKMRTERNFTAHAPFVRNAIFQEENMAQNEKAGGKSKGGKSGGTKSGGSQKDTRAAGSAGGGPQSGQKSQSR